MEAIFAYLVIINSIGFIVMWLDKHKAIKQQYRIPERHLFLLGLIGGAGGVWVSMRMFRHKTKHKSFVYGIPLLFIVNMLVVGFFIYKLWPTIA